MYWTGKLLEVVGMMMVLTGFVMGLQNKELVRFELGMLGVGSAVFYIGWLLERRKAS